MPVSEYLQWRNELTARELIDAHLADLRTSYLNAHGKNVKTVDLMFLVTKEDKKEKLANILKAEFAKFGDKIKIEGRK